MARGAAIVSLVLLAIGACGPRVHGSRYARSPAEPIAPTSPSSTAPLPPPTAATGAPSSTDLPAPSATSTSSASSTTAPLPPPTASASSTTSEPPISDDLVPACRFHCDSLRNACAAGDPSGCYALCDEYDRTLSRTCRGAMATYFRCLAWTVSCEGGQPRSDVGKCIAEKQVLDACRG